MDPEQVLFQFTIFGSVAINLDASDLDNLLKAYNRETIDYSVPIFDRVEKKICYLPGITPQTLRIMELIQDCGLQGSFLRAAKNDLANLLPVCIKMGANIDERDHIGVTALMYASSFGYEATVSILLAHGGDVNISSGAVSDVLTRAAVNGRNSIVLMLLEHDPTMIQRFGEFALHCAEQMNHLEIVELLRSRINT